jgi:hypothetical protein
LILAAKLSRRYRDPAPRACRSKTVINRRYDRTTGAVAPAEKTSDWIVMVLAYAMHGVCEHHESYSEC